MSRRSDSAGCELKVYGREFLARRGTRAAASRFCAARAQPLLIGADAPVREQSAVPAPRESPARAGARFPGGAFGEAGRRRALECEVAEPPA